MPRTTLDCTPYYFQTVFTDAEMLLDQAADRLQDVDFDTIVATGLSGTIFAGLLAQRLGKHLIIVRKADDASTHSSNRIEGILGKRWLFVDDLISSGNTLRHVVKQVELVAGRGSVRDWMDEPPFATEWVGTYLYNSERYMSAFESREEACMSHPEPEVVEAELIEEPVVEAPVITADSIYTAPLGTSVRDLQTLLNEGGPWSKIGYVTPESLTFAAVGK